MTETTLQLSQKAPRYTSYPTAPNFHQGITAKTYEAWLSELPDNASLSLYIHIPFCSSLCWFCGCHTKITRQYAPIATYLQTLKKEVHLIAPLIPAEHQVSMVHFGGGSPAILANADFTSLVEILRSSFNISRDTSIDMEIDPRGISGDKIDNLTGNGVSRISIGVQDFNSHVQQAINRIQSFEETKTVIDQFRSNGVASINLDLLYGLPNQSLKTIDKTLSLVNQLAPERISYFGYAHVPWMKKHQKLINQENLPDHRERLNQSNWIAQNLVNQGYRHIGIDHFALPEDPLTTAVERGTLKRNFQGYTTDSADAVIAFGASSISQLPQGYVQNTPHIQQYIREVNSSNLAAAKGVEVTIEDKIRRNAIEQLMCYQHFTEDRLLQEYGNASHDTISKARQIMQQYPENLVKPTKNGFFITEAGRPYTRLICTHFDAYLPQTKTRHAPAV